MYRIAGIFRGYKYSWFLLIKRLPQTFIPNIACMLQKGCYSTKTFLTVIPRKFIPLKCTRYTIYMACMEAQFFTCTTLFDYAHAMDVQSSTSGVRGSSCELRNVYASLFCM